MSGLHCVDIPGEVQIDVLHRYHLGVATAAGTAFDPKGRALGRLTRSVAGSLADLHHCRSQSKGGDCLSLPQRSGSDGRHRDKLSVRPVLQSLQRIK